MQLLKKLILGTTLLTLGVSVQAKPHETTTLGKPMSIEKGKCEEGSQWELTHYANGWLLVKGLAGYFIGLDSRVLIARACGHMLA